MFYVSFVLGGIDFHKFSMRGAEQNSGSSGSSPDCGTLGHGPTLQALLYLSGTEEYLESRKHCVNSHHPDPGMSLRTVLPHLV